MLLSIGKHCVMIPRSIWLQILSLSKLIYVSHQNWLKVKLSNCGTIGENDRERESMVWNFFMHIPRTNERHLIAREKRKRSTLWIPQMMIVLLRLDHHCHCHHHLCIPHNPLHQLLAHQTPTTTVMMGSVRVLMRTVQQVTVEISETGSVFWDLCLGMNLI